MLVLGRVTHATFKFQDKTGLKFAEERCAATFWVGGFNPFEKYATVKLDHFSRDQGEHKKNVLKAPPSSWLMVGWRLMIVGVDAVWWF